MLFKMYVHPDDRTNSMSKKQHLTDVLRNDLLKGAYPLDKPLPTEMEIASQFGVSRHTVRAALDQLKNEGLLFTRHGIGSFARPPGEAPKYTQSFVSTDDLLMHTEDTAFRIVKREEQTVAHTQAQPLIGLLAGERWLSVTVERSSRSTGQPISRAIVYARPVFFEELRRFEAGEYPLFALIERRNGGTLEIEQYIVARAASVAEATYFGVKRNSPLLEITRVYFGPDRTPYEVTVTAYNAATFRYVSTITPTKTTST